MTGAAIGAPAFPFLDDYPERPKRKRYAPKPVDVAPPPMPAGEYRVILADPPWKYDSNTGPEGCADEQYPTMTNDAMAALPVGRLAHPDCALLMWATMPKLEDAMGVMRAWGFRYVTTPFVWVKLNPSGVGFHAGMGNYTMGNVEVVLLAKRVTEGPRGGVRLAKIERFRKDVKQLIVEPRGRHSRKPDEVARRIELLLPGPRIELFARRARPGWDVWGNEAPPPQYSQIDQNPDGAAAG